MESPKKSEPVDSLPPSPTNGGRTLLKEQLEEVQRLSAERALLARKFEDAKADALFNKARRVFDCFLGEVSYSQYEVVLQIIVI